MSQASVLKFLEKNKRSWYTLAHIKKVLKIRPVSENAAKLYHSKDIDRIELVLNGRKCYLVRYKVEGRDSNL